MLSKEQNKIHTNDKIKLFNYMRDNPRVGMFELKKIFSWALINERYMINLRKLRGKIYK